MENRKTRLPSEPWLFIACVLGTTWLLESPVQAHISMKGALQSRGGDQKQAPCDGARGDGPVYTFAPGTTITLAVNEDVPHPSYFRIAFDDDGQDFLDPTSIDPIDKTRACPFDMDDQCGKADYCDTTRASKGVTVLWDDLNPHLASAAMGGTWNVKLPDMECDNCTLQVIQVMEDTVHGAYCPSDSCAASANSLEDIYHRCVDIKLVKGAPTGPGVTMDSDANNKGMKCAAAASGAAGSGSAGMMAVAGSSSAGTSATAGTTGAAGTGATSAGTGATMAGTSASAGSNAGTATAGRSSVAGVGGSSASTSTSAAGSGNASSGTTMTAAAGKSAAGASSTTSAVTGAAAPAVAAPAPSTKSGGCSVATLQSRRCPDFTWATALLLAIIAFRRRASSRPQVASTSHGA